MPWVNPLWVESEQEDFKYACIKREDTLRASRR